MSKQHLNYLQIVSGAVETKNVVATCFGNEAMKNMLPHLLEQLELCQKSLSAYLETKRAEFPVSSRLFCQMSQTAAQFVAGLGHLLAASAASAPFVLACELLACCFPVCIACFMIP